VDLAGVAPGQAVLDVACGTGIVARTVAVVQGGQGQVVGLDVNEAMLHVARRVRPEINWRQGDAAHLPFPAGAFDVALCQMALMFFPDRTRVLREMARVVGANGTVAFAVPGSLESQPAYGSFVEMAARHAGPEAISLLSAYFVCGDLDALGRLIESAGLRVAASRTYLGAVWCGSVDEFVATEATARECLPAIVSPPLRDNARILPAMATNRAGSR
jgi:SAM-dependent methyltransferase